MPEKAGEAPGAEGRDSQLLAYTHHLKSTTTGGSVVQWKETCFPAWSVIT